MPEGGTLRVGRPPGCAALPDRGRGHRPRHGAPRSAPACSSRSSRSSTAAPGSAWRSSTGSCRSTAASWRSTAGRAAARASSCELPRRARRSRRRRWRGSRGPWVIAWQPRLLVVDDEASCWSSWASSSRARATASRPRASVAEARRMLGERGYDLVLCDILMPDGSGLDLLREVQARRRGHGGDHDDRLHLDQLGDRGDEARRLRLHLQAVRRRGAQGGGAEGAREGRAGRRERLPASASSRSATASATSSGAGPRCAPCSRSSTAWRAPARRC